MPLRGRYTQSCSLFISGILDRLRESKRNPRSKSLVALERVLFSRVAVRLAHLDSFAPFGAVVSARLKAIVIDAVLEVLFPFGLDSLAGDAWIVCKGVHSVGNITGNLCFVVSKLAVNDNF